VLTELGISGSEADVAKSLLTATTNKQIDDIYYIYMWNYCSGSLSQNGSSQNITYCSPRKAQFYFDPLTTWGLNNTVVQQALGSSFQKGINAYKTGAKWMFIAYVVAFWVTVGSIVVGFFAICSRLGSCATTVVSSAATLFTFAAALTSTILFSTLTGVLDAALKPYKIKLSIGSRMLAVDWLAVAFSVAATLFWTISICCCSGRSNREKNRGDKHSDYASNVAPFGSRGYQPLGEHQHSGSGAVAQNHEMQTFGHESAGPYKGRETAYEPLRHV
jgi:hypothetical protein